MDFIKNIPRFEITVFASPFGESTMFQLLESPVVIWSIVMFFVVVLFLYFFTMLPKTSGENQIILGITTKVDVTDK